MVSGAKIDIRITEEFRAGQEDSYHIYEKLCYNNKDNIHYKTYCVGKIKFSERFQLQELVNELNENNTLKREKKEVEIEVLT